MKTKSFNLFINLLYPIADFCAVFFAMIGSYRLYRFLNIGKQVSYTNQEQVTACLIGALIAVAILQLFGAYKHESSLLNVDEIKSVSKGITVCYLLFALILYFATIYLSRYTLVLSYIISLILLVSLRTLLYHLLPITAKFAGLNQKILIYGAGELGQALFRNIVNSPKRGITPVGFIDDDESKLGQECSQSGFSCTKGIAVLGTGSDLVQLKDQYGVDEVWVAISNVDNAVLLQILNSIKKTGVKACFIPNLYKVFVHNLSITTIGDLPLVEEVGEKQSAYLVFKKYFDFIVAFTFILIFWPLFLLIMLLIKLDSKGKTIFKHERVGKNGKVFQVYKFRTMHMETDPLAPSPKSHDDPRITRVGRFLRRTSLDELPQVFNILKGDMSLVGPRPEMPFIVDSYNEVQRERLKLTPGLTGMWQLSGDRQKAIHENMDYDLYYIRHVSFFLDIAILIETFIFAFRGI